MQKKNQYVDNMSSCSLIPKVRKSDGTIVESKLFNSLLSYTNSRRQAKEYYAIGKNQEFLELVADKARFDENGEIKFNSLRTLAKLDIEENRIIDSLNKEIKAGIYNYEEALSILQMFNRSHSMNDGYLATISNVEEGKVKLEVVPNNESNKNKLIENIQNRALHERIKYYLASNGVNVAFLDDPNVEGRYSTTNAERTSDGLYTLIKIARGEKGNDALMEEAGHFVVGALGNDPLVQRLLEILTPQMQEQILGEDKYNELYGRQNPDREVAGYLVGQALRSELDKQSYISKIISRIINKAKRVFYRLRGDEVGYLKTEAKEIAEKLADGFMSDNFKGSVENALNTEETLYSASDSVAVSTLKQVIRKFHAIALRMRNIDNKLSKQYFMMLDQVDKGKYLKPGNAMSDIIAIQGLLETLSMIPSQLVSIQQKVANIDFNYDSINNETAAVLMEAQTFIKNIEEIKKTIEDTLIPDVDSSNKMNADDLTIDTMRMLVGEINNILVTNNRGSQGLTALVLLKSREFYAKFLELGLGKRYVTKAARKIFKRVEETDKKTGKKVKRLRLINEDAKDLDLYQMLREQEEDEGYFHSVLTSMSNATALTNQAIDKIFRRYKKVANDRVLAIRNELIVLEKKLKDINGNTDEFFERDPNTNELTGSIIDKYLWGVIDAEYQELYESERQKFNESVDKSNKTRNELSLLWAKYWNPIDKAFKDSHFQLAADGKTLVPVDAYINEYYKQNIEGTAKEIWLNEYKAIKTMIDEECLGRNAVPHRAPQFKGLNMNRLRNRMANASFSSALGNTIWENVTETFLEDSEDRDFGSAVTYNPDEQTFNDQEIIESEKIRRIPLFGINKLKDMNALSTDLFQSTLAYASMAYRYNISKQFANMLELGKEVMSETSYGKKKLVTGDKKTPNSFNRLQKFLDKELYGIKTEKVTLGKLVLNKLFSFFSNLASKAYLGGNVAGGAVNVLTGSIEIFKEAASGEHFNLKEWKRANKEYFNNLPDNMLHMGDLVKFDKISLLIDRFDTKNDSETKAFEHHTKKSNLWRLNPLGHNLFLPYTVGEHYMQTIAFIATAIGTKLYDAETGEETNLYDALVTEDIIANGKKVGQKLVLSKEYVTDRAFVTDYKIMNEISNIANSNSFVMMFTPEQLDFMQRNNIDSTAGKEVILAGLREVRSKILWDSMKESDYMDKCREVNNRLHGIYNSQDKTLMHQKFYLNALTSMRNYAFGMINRRFGTSIYSVSLGHDTEGSLNTVAKVFASTFTDEKGWLLTARALNPFLAFSDKTKTMMLSAGFSANQYANIRRNAMDTLFIIGLALLKLALSLGEGEDDEEDNIGMGICYYFTSRLLREQQAFNNPLGWAMEMPSLTSTETTGLSILYDMLEIVELAGLEAIGSPDANYQRGGALYEKDDSKLFYKLKRLCPYYKSIMTLENPYYSAQSYNYGRRNVSK